MEKTKTESLLDEVCKFYNIKNYTTLSDSINVGPSVISQWIKRDSLGTALQYIIEFIGSQDTKFSLDEFFFSLSQPQKKNIVTVINRGLILEESNTNFSKAEIAIEKIKATFKIKSNLAVSQFFGISNSTLQSWLQRNSFGQIYETLYNLRETGKISPNFSIESFFMSQSIEDEPQNQKLPNIMDDFLCFYGTEKEVMVILEAHLNDKLLSRFTTLKNVPIEKFLDIMIFIKDEPLDKHPFFFLYYIFQVIKSDQDEIDKIENFKAFILEKINNFKKHPILTESTKYLISEAVEFKFSEDECKDTVFQTLPVINLLEKSMSPSAITKTHRDIWLKERKDSQ